MDFYVIGLQAASEFRPIYGQSLGDWYSILARLQRSRFIVPVGRSLERRVFFLV